MLVDHWEELTVSIIAYIIILIYIYIRTRPIEKRLDLILDTEWRPACFKSTNNTSVCVYCPWKGECQ